MFVLMVASAGTARAGLYFPSEDKLWPGGKGPEPTSARSFRLVLSSLFGLPSEQNAGDLRKAYVQKADELAKKAATLTTAERVDLSACYLRLGKPEEAQAVLEPVARGEAPHFMVLANLATANEMANRMDRAISYEEQALSRWPREVDGISPEKLRWYRRVEKYHLTLLKLRYRESAGGSRTPQAQVDALFPGFGVWKEGQEYQAGAVAPEVWAELPGDAVPIVQQLLIWLPQDSYLYWLLGELVNARGDVAQATDILSDLMQRNFAPGPIIRQHLRTLREARTAAGKLEIGQEATEDSPAPSSAPAPLPTAPASWLPDLRHVVVSFAAGAIVAFLIGQQWRQAGRRRSPAERSG
jgi:tetratricopeptide (TPR) repeat protein